MRTRRLHKHRLSVNKSLKNEVASQNVPEYFVIDISGGSYKIWNDEFLPLGILPEFVKEIKAAKNLFATIGISNLQNFIALEVLDFSRNLISDLNDFQWHSMQYVRHLDLSRNQLTTIPDGLTGLPLLEVLKVQHNRLTELPSSIARMRPLRILDASYNNITTIGDLLETLPYLEELNLVGNSDTIETGMSPHTTRLFRKRALLSSKSERRALIQRALGIRRNVLTREQDAILQEIEAAKFSGDAIPYP